MTFNEIGQLVATRAVSLDTQADPEFNNHVVDCVMRYMSCDWGDTHPDDKPLNDSAVKNGDDRVLAVYKSDRFPTIWIITEWDRSVTTILYPDEY